MKSLSVLVVTLVLALAGTAQAGELCPPGMEMSSTAFSCVPLGSGGSVGDSVGGSDALERV